MMESIFPNFTAEKIYNASSKSMNYEPNACARTSLSIVSTSTIDNNDFSLVVTFSFYKNIFDSSLFNSCNQNLLAL
ncbi:hypothetical protein BMS3Abin03_01330 [bacterium BMS3Abin03]|nr:hypothetical protein BMS3Abin03_01330 [bacterium BMS3Abin03]